MICGLARTHKADIDAAWGAIKDSARPADPHLHLDLRHPHRAPAADRPARTSRGRRGRPSRWRGPTARTSSSRRWTRPAPRSSSPPRSARSRSRRARPWSTSPTRSATRRRRSTRATSAGSTSWSPALRDGRDLGPLPRRPGLAVANSYAGRAGRRPPGRVRGQRDRRAGRQLLAGGDRDADPDPRATSTGSTPASTPASWRAPAAWSRRLTGYAVQPNKAVVGRNAFAHESGHPPGRRAEGAHAPTRSWTRPKSAWSRTRSCSASTPAATRCATRWSSSASRSRATR